MWYLPDPTGQLTALQAWQRTGQFRRVKAEIAQFEPRWQPHWVRVRVANGAPEPQSFVAELDYPFLESIQFFLLSDRGQVLASGPVICWNTPPEHRPLSHHNPLFLFELQGGQSAWLMSRSVGNKMRHSIPLRLHTSQGFGRFDRQQHLFWGWTVGLLAFVVLFNFLFFALVRDPVFVFHGLYVIATGLYLIANKGFWQIWFGPTLGPFTVLSLTIAFFFSAILSCFLLIRVYVLPAVWHYPLIRWVSLGSVAGLCGAIALVLLNNTDADSPVAFLMRRGEMVLYLVPVVLNLTLVVWLLLRRPPQAEQPATTAARLYTLAITPPLIEVFLGLLVENNLIDDSAINREGIVFAGLLEFLILSAVLMIRYKQMADERRRLQNETHRQHQQAIQVELKLQQEQNRALEAQLRLQQEKERIARDLHDHVGAQLSVIASSLDHVRIIYPLNGTAVHLEHIGTFAREAIGSLRETIWAINQEYIPLGEFQIQLRQYLQRQQALLPTTRLQLVANLVDPAALLTSEQVLNLFRIAQEAVGNALRHARAQTIVVRIRTDDAHRLHMEVGDDGVGFDPSAKYPGHYGLLNMQLRAERLGATWQVCSETGRGTTLSLVMPRQPVRVR